MHAALEDVAASHPQLTTGHLTTGRASVVEQLAQVGTAAELSRAADVVQTPELVTLLRESAQRAGR